MSNNTGGPAFPAHHFDLAEGEHGMTLRDWFAGKAMQGMLANPELKESIFQGAENGVLEKSAWAIADAMLKARENNNE